ncbi:hypothetical protein LVO79_20925 (plasmid) [Roseivivax marinus]|uniref:hypothetical protein n=1 Tax=Roseivivax marinus TaxID=1379903 RepID=UPI001F034C57|nr:hypothetical protein [Roseivivax marinus]UMA67268.1 hypothetical protein LVO79_20925 [Roseivivax marinus]
MDHVLVKLKRLRKNPFRKLLSDTTLYPTITPTDVTLVAYNPDHNLDEDSWFVIEDFCEQPFFPSELSEDIDSKDYDDLKREKFGDIYCLLSLQGDDIYFQKVTPSSFIKRKMISFGEAATLEEGENRIVVKKHPDAVFLRGDDKLLFRDIASISSIFKGIDQLYKEATEDQVKEFLALEFIEAADGYDHSSVSKPNRKRLALVSDTLKNMPPEQKTSLIDYIKAYCKDGVELSDGDDKFKVSSDKQLKLILYGIEERFYTTPHSQEKRLANSVESMG